MKYIKLYFLVLVVLLPIDAFYLLVLAFDFYRNSLSHILLVDEVVWADILIYIIYPFGVSYFVVLPALEKKSARVASKNGSIFGFVVYGYYNLVNQAMLIGWPPLVTLIDIIWGVLLTSFVGYCVYHVIDYYQLKF